MDIPRDEKIRYMVEWWKKAHELLIHYEFNQNMIGESVGDAQILLRSGMTEFVNMLSSRQIPLTVFSAGLADVITELFDQYKLSGPNLHVVSNRMKFDETGKLIGFHDPIIHSLNKYDASVTLRETDPTFWEQLDTRPNILLLGDSLGDAHMSDSLKADTVLKIGFLNCENESEIAARMPRYLEAFDVVLTKDAPLDYVLMILDSVCS
eukprot:TRINITY_DN370_c0_g1_i8.p1 TRINITY_DN370_c0_g1~~TRINITY_DN370_c0_g1_i8.p1  ORF type:complete len:208 (+),score=39.76 TRINITY_DN370_c0_g1_i8:416-1039(+)